MNVKLSKFIDRTLGSVLCAVLGIIPNRKPSNEIKSIAIIKLWALGESVLTLPMIKEIKKKYPNAKIDIIATKRNADVYTNHPLINEVKIFPKINQKYDVAIDCEPYLNLSALIAWKVASRRIGFSHGIRSVLYTDKTAFNDKQHEVLTYIDLAMPLGIKAKPTELVELQCAKETINKVKQLFPDKNMIGFCPGTAESGLSRSWQPEKFAQCADILAKKYNSVPVFIGTKSEEEKINNIISMMKTKAINAAGKTNVKELFCLVKLFKFLVSNDTGPMHIAAAQKTPTVGLFCPNTPVRFAPFGKRNTYVYRPVRNEPCINVHKGQIPDCSTHNHMSKISVNDVVKAVEKIA